MTAAGINPAVFDRALYDRASRKKSRGFDPALYERLLEERRAGGISASASAVSGSRRATASGGTPSTIWGANLVLWYNSVAGSSTSTLTDQSSGGRNATGTGTINATDATLNNLKTVGLPGTTDYVASFNFPTPGTTPSCTIVIAKTAAFAGSFAYDFRADSSATMVFGGATQTSSTGFFTNGNTLALAMTYNVWSARRCDFSNSASDVQSIGATTGTGNAGNSVPGTGLRIGGISSGQALTLYEVVILNRLPTAPEMVSYYAGLDSATASAVAHP